MINLTIKIVTNKKILMAQIYEQVGISIYIFLFSIIITFYAK